MAKSAGSAFSTATDLADWLVRELNLPFRQAHHATGEIVALAESQDKALHELNLSQMQAVKPEIHQGIFDVLSPENSVASRTSVGGTAPDNVRAQVKAWQERLQEG